MEKVVSHTWRLCLVHLRLYKAMQNLRINWIVLKAVAALNSDPFL